MSHATHHPTDASPVRSSDPVRYVNAQAASHGFGAGRTRASRLIEGWTAEETAAQAAQVLENLETAQAYAEREPMPFEDYVNGLRADEELARTLTPERLATLETVFVTGFDIGFRACLVEHLAETRERAQTLAETR
jgi:hypothetical protein